MTQKQEEDMDQPAETKDSTAVRVDREGLAMMQDIFRLLQTKGLDAFPALVQPDLTPSSWGEAPSRARVVRAALRLLKQDTSLRVARSEGPDRPPTAVASIPGAGAGLKAVVPFDVLSSRLRELARELDFSFLDPSGALSCLGDREDHDGIALGWLFVTVSAPTGLGTQWDARLLEAVLDQTASYSSGGFHGNDDTVIIFVRAGLLFRLSEDIFHIWKESRVDHVALGMFSHPGDTRRDGRVIYADRLEAILESLSQVSEQQDLSEKIAALSTFSGKTEEDITRDVAFLGRLMRREFDRRLKPTKLSNDLGPRTTHPATLAVRDEQQRRALARRLGDMSGPSLPLKDTVSPIPPQPPIDRVPGNPSGLLVAAYGAPGLGVITSSVNTAEIE